MPVGISEDRLRAAECLVKQTVEVFAMRSCAQATGENIEGAFCASDRNIGKAETFVRFFGGFLLASLTKNRVKSANFRWWKFKSPLHGSVLPVMKVHQVIAARRERTPVDLRKNYHVKIKSLGCMYR